MPKNVRIYKGLQLPLRSVLGRFGSSYPLFTLVRGRGILRTSPFGDSAKFAYTEFYEVQLRVQSVVVSEGLCRPPAASPLLRRSRAPSAGTPPTISYHRARR